MNISLNPRFNNFINELVKSGSYNSASEVIRDALRLLEHEHIAKEARTLYYKNAIQKGIDSGTSTEWNIEDTLAKAHKRMNNSELDI